MPSSLRYDQCCHVKGCLRPARELAGLCSQCWRGLAPEKRDTLRWEAANDAAERDTVEFDPVSEAEAILRDEAA